jgi:hypothetical protein
MSDIEDLKKRLRGLEDHIATMNECDTARLSASQLDRAQFMALCSIVREFALHAGISSESFSWHYEERVRWWHDYFLRQCEDVSPQLSAQLDQRTIGEADVGASYPPLFDPPPSTQT